jgi:protein-S-isoprenylcysteine O-methyltransferase Ste14
MFIVSPLDYRFGWSSVAWPAVAAGDVLTVIGFAIVFATLRENSFAAAIVEVEQEQPVIDSGPYSLVRHPMYSGALLMFLGTPPALGSWWGLLPAAILIGAIVWRLRDEERYLTQHLTGYGDYLQRVRYRLVPGLW